MYTVIANMRTSDVTKTEMICCVNEGENIDLNAMMAAAMTLEEIIIFIRNSFMYKLYLVIFVTRKYLSIEIQNNNRNEEGPKNRAEKEAALSRTQLVRKLSDIFEMAAIGNVITPEQRSEIFKTRISLFDIVLSCLVL